MDANLSIFLIMAVSILAAVVLILGTAWIRGRNRGAALERRARDDAGEVAQLTTENEALRGRVERQEARLQVLERIATDPSARTAAEIELLR
ncbi:MAG TPA: hypothetical protein VGB54_07410 [Allosphingosinicella sp.]|jgi:membrane protein implicated in regulation of membrane protease activity